MSDPVEQPVQPVDYTFNASALGVGGFYDRDGKRFTIPSLASVALAPTGGEGIATAENFNQHGIALASATSRVRGVALGGVFVTTSEIEIARLSVFGRLSIGRLKAVVTSERNTANTGDDEAKFNVTASFENVMIDGGVVDPTIDAPVCGASYDAHHVEVVKSGVFPPGKEPSHVRGDCLRRSVVNGFTFVRQPGVPVKNDGPYVLNVPGLGKIFFGELLVKRGRRRLNLLRFEFAPPPKDRPDLAALSPHRADSGMLSIASGDGNGEPIWPRTNP